MSFERIDSAIEICDLYIGNLDSDNIADKEVETYLVSGLVTLIISEYEDYLEKIFSLRAERCGDACVSNYVKLALSQNFRSPDLGKINNTLARFNPEYKRVFMREIENSRHHAAWDSIMKARHAVVHKKGQLNMTFRELKIAYPLTKIIIENVETTLE